MEKERDYDLFLKAAEAVGKTGRILLDSGENLRIGEKGKTDFVTPVDLEVQEELCRRLRELAPDYEFMGEEKENRNLDLSGKLWILDPVDGTTNLIHQFQHSTVSLAMAYRGNVMGGIVFQPFSGEMFLGFQGKGAWCGRKPIHVSRNSVLRDSLFSVGTNPGYRQHADRSFSIMRSFYDCCHDIRRIGAASLEICYVAAGRLEGYVEYGLKPWDYAAGARILEEAGGLCTDCSGRIPVCTEPADILATNKLVHSEALSLLL